MKKDIQKSMLKHSKAPFWQAILFSILLVTFIQLSSSVDASPADQDATKQENLEAQVAPSELDNVDGEGRYSVYNNVYLGLFKNCQEYFQVNFC